MAASPRQLLPPLVTLGFLIGIGLVLSRRDGFVAEERTERFHGKLIHETVSDYSHIRVRDRDGVRSLYFVDKNGMERRQSAIDLAAPERLLLGYSRALFLSLLFREPQSRVLIVGLGGGGMVRFVNHALPDTRVDAVEIDPVVVEVAAEFFGTADGPRTTIHTEDAFLYLGDPEGPRYDVIYMDAFLRPPTGGSGLEAVAQRLKTERFLQTIRGRLVQPGGVVAFNLIRADRSTPEDLAAIEATFPSVYRFPVPGTGNLVVIGALDPERPGTEDLKRRAEALDARLDLGYSLRALVAEDTR